MPKGIDSSANCAAAATCLKNAGYEFVARYYANSGRKVLTAAEAQQLLHVGLQLVAIWEDGLPKTVGYFSYSKGVDDGTSAFHDAMRLGQPLNSPIYFAVDYDASPDHIAGSIADYFRGIADGFKTIGAGGPVHPIGVYGSGATCSWLLGRGAVRYSWLSQSRKWAQHDFRGWNIKQGSKMSVCGIDIDPDDAVDDYGGFQLPMLTAQQTTGNRLQQ